MLKIEYIENADKELYKLMDNEFNKFENINLTTYKFQVPEFYKGFKIDFIRENKEISSRKVDYLYFL